MVITKAWGWGKSGDVSQSTNFQLQDEYVLRIYRIVTIAFTTVVHLEVVKRVNLKCSHCKNKK